MKTLIIPTVAFKNFLSLIKFTRGLDVEPVWLVDKVMSVTQKCNSFLVYANFPPMIGQLLTKKA